MQLWHGGTVPPPVTGIHPLDSRLEHVLDTLALDYDDDGCSFEEAGTSCNHLVSMAETI